MVCHATGFYPDGVMITWKRDGKELQEDVWVGETLPNEDGTFQKRVELRVSPEERRKGHYTCEVAHNSGELVVQTLSEDGLSEDGMTDQKLHTTHLLFTYHDGVSPKCDVNMK